MKAVVYEHPKAFTVKQIPTPEPAPGQVLARIVVTGICGTDLHIHNGDFFASFPLTPGHEPVGVVEKIGADVSGLRVGEQVAINGNWGCGKCDFCQRGAPLLCKNLTALGVTGPGGFAEYMLAPAGQFFSVDDLPADVAALTEPTACAMHGMEMLGMRPGSDALLFGAGPTGLILGQLLMHTGAARVTIAAPTLFKLDLAHSFGIDETVRVDRNDPVGAADRLLKMTPEGYDIVVDATGDPRVTQECLRLTKDGGTILVYGVTKPDDRVAWSPYEIYRREITIKGSFAQVNSFPKAVASLRSGRVHTEGIITHRFALDQFGDALDALRDDPTCLKAVIVP